MNKRIFVLAILFSLFCILPSIVQAEVTMRNVGTGDFIGYYSGDRLLVDFSPTQMNLVFGEGNWEVDPAGLFVASYMHVGQKKEIGVFSGTLVGIGAGNLVVGEGAFVSSYPPSNPVKIDGHGFLLNVLDPTRISLAITNGTYSQGHYFFGCATDSSEAVPCKMNALITPLTAYLNITGKGFAGPTSGLRQFFREGYFASYNSVEQEDATKKFILLRDLQKISVNSAPYLSITALSLDGEGTLDEFTINSRLPFKVTQKFQNDERGFGGLSPFYLFEGKYLEISSRYFHNVVGIKPTGSEGINFNSPEIDDIFVTSGTAFIFSDSSSKYKDNCLRNEEAYNGAACILENIADSSITVVPKSAIENGVLNPIRAEIYLSGNLLYIKYMRK